MQKNRFIVTTVLLRFYFICYGCIPHGCNSPKPCFDFCVCQVRLNVLDSTECELAPQPVCRQPDLEFSVDTMTCPICFSKTATNSLHINSTNEIDSIILEIIRKLLQEFRSLM